MIVILGLDGLDVRWVERYKLKALMQRAYTKTSLKDYRGEQAYTNVIWASMLTGEIDREMEKVFLDREPSSSDPIPPAELTSDWLVRRGIRTIFDEVGNCWHNSIPGYSGNPKHREDMELVKRAIEGDTDAFDRIEHRLWERYREGEESLMEALDRKPNLIFFYTNLLDALGHLRFGESAYRFKLYRELDELAQKVHRRAEEKDKVYIISDHGMGSLGRFGDHTKNGFFSSNTGELINKPFELYRLIKKGLGDRVGNEEAILG